MINIWNVCQFKYLGFYHYQVYKVESEKPLTPPVVRVYALGVFETEEQAQRYADELNRREIVEAVQLNSMVKRKGE